MCIWELKKCSTGLRRFNALRGYCFFFFPTNWRCVATLRRASLLAPFFRQHLLTLCLCHTLVILPGFQTSSLLLYVMAICDVTIVTVLGEHHQLYPHKTGNLIDTVCVLTAPPTGHALSLSLSSPLSLFPETQQYWNLGQLITLQWL